MVQVEVNFMFFVMFWTILAMMLLLLYSLKQVMLTQKHIQNIDVNIQGLVSRTLNDEEIILKRLTKKRTKHKK